MMGQLSHLENKTTTWELKKHMKVEKPLETQRERAETNRMTY